MMHKKLNLNEQLVYKLFPFHLLISLQSERRLLSAGSAVQRLLPADYLERSFDELFKITRPVVDVLSVEQVARCGSSIVFY